jgi:hypothetical protein
MAPNPQGLLKALTSKATFGPSTSDRINMLYAAVHESGYGTFRTCADSLTMSAHRGKADIKPTGRHFRF